MTVIICPACNTRFETAAVIPPTGRKVRCSKCGNVWQAIAVTEAAKPTVITAPTPPPVAPRPAPAAPRPSPAAPPPSAAPRPAPPEARPGAAGPGNAIGRFPGAPVPPATPAAPAAPVGARPNSGAFPGAGPAAAPMPPPLPNKRGPLFGTDEEIDRDILAGVDALLEVALPGQEMIDPCFDRIDVAAD